MLHCTPMKLMACCDDLLADLRAADSLLVEPLERTVVVTLLSLSDGVDMVMACPYCGDALTVEK